LPEFGGEKFTVLTALSPETKIKSTLRELNCAESSFAKLVVGIVGKTRIAQGLSSGPDQRDFVRADAERLLEFVEEMRELQLAAGVPVAWERTELVHTVLVARRVQRIAAELDRETSQGAV
jgi:hypothetical protein